MYFPRMSSFSLDFSSVCVYIHVHRYTYIYTYTLGQICHALFHFCLVAQLSPILCNPMSPLGSSVHEILQEILEWVAMPISKRSSWPRDWTLASCIDRWILYHWATREAWCHAYTHSLTQTRWHFQNQKVPTLSEYVCVRSVASASLRPYGPQPAGLLKPGAPWAFAWRVDFLPMSRWGSLIWVCLRIIRWLTFAS